MCSREKLPPGPRLRSPPSAGGVSLHAPVHGDSVAVSMLGRAEQMRREVEMAINGVHNSFSPAGGAGSRSMSGGAGGGERGEKRGGGGGNKGSCSARDASELLHGGYGVVRRGRSGEVLEVEKYKNAAQESLKRFREAADVYVSPSKMRGALGSEQIEMGRLRESESEQEKIWGRERERGVERGGGLGGGSRWGVEREMEREREREQDQERRNGDRDPERERDMAKGQEGKGEEVWERARARSGNWELERDRQRHGGEDGVGGRRGEGGGGGGGGEGSLV